MPVKTLKELIVDQVITGGSLDQFVDMYISLNYEMRDYMWAESSLEQKCLLYSKWQLDPEKYDLLEKHRLDDIFLTEMKEMQKLKKIKIIDQIIENGNLIAFAKIYTQQDEELRDYMWRKGSPDQKHYVYLWASIEPTKYSISRKHLFEHQMDIDARARREFRVLKRSHDFRSLYPRLTDAFK